MWLKQFTYQGRPALLVWNANAERFQGRLHTTADGTWRMWDPERGTEEMVEGQDSLSTCPHVACASSWAGRRRPWNNHIAESQNWAAAPRPLAGKVVAVIRSRLSFLSQVALFAVLLGLTIGPGWAQRNRGGPAPPSTGAIDAGSSRDERVQTLRQRVAGPWLGLVIKDAEGVTGAQVFAVNPNSPGEQAGVQKGDVLTRLANWPVASVADYRVAVTKLSVGTDYPLVLLREGRPLTVTIRPVPFPSMNGGGQAVIADTPAARTGPLDINTLRYVLIDPHTPRSLSSGATIRPMRPDRSRTGTC